MGNPRREYLVFTKYDCWELWQCHGNNVRLLGDTFSHDRFTSEVIDKKDNICNIRKSLGFTKFYGNKQDVEDYLFILAV